MSNGFSVSLMKYTSDWIPNELLQTKNLDLIVALSLACLLREGLAMPAI